tara:strand:+ start:2429 stop:2626 length:198 start_codon:yes stop_codon:yes gene_type:complete
MSPANGLDYVYVVTRNGRRVEPHNYTSKKLASDRFKSLLDQVKSWDPKTKNNVEIVKTTEPHRIR